jgi:hypothetical protein
MRTLRFTAAAALLFALAGGAFNLANFVWDLVHPSAGNCRVCETKAADDAKPSFPEQ